MFRNFYTEGRLSDGQSAPSSAPFGVASVGFDSQESSWIGLLSRPALSLLRKVRRWSAAPAELSNSFIGEEREILRQLNEIIPHHLSFTQCPLDGAGGLPEQGFAGSVPWLSAVPVRHVGTELQPQVGSLSAVRALLGSQEAAGGKPWAVSPAGKSGPWWGSFLRRADIQPERSESQTNRPPDPESSGDPQQLNNADTVQNMVARPGPEQDQGYHSLEEELTQGATRSPPEEQQPQMEPVPEEPEPGAEEVLSTPQCGNKSIAFIMGLPCSDDDSSLSESGSDDDDGFDSEGSSDLTSDEDEDDEASDSDSEPDQDSERLWSSFSRSFDPYNPQSFTASLHTGRCPPADPGAPLPDPVPSHAASSPPSGQDTWDDSASASEADEAESLRLLRSFSSSLDLYSPLNFQAPLRTQGPVGPPGPPSRTRNRTSPQNAHQNLAAPPEYRREEAEERLDSGFAEAAASNRSTKKVRFCDEVEEFFASCGEEEDRRGPWEELARDRCRFRRRCQEVERSIGFCLAPAHRHRVYQGLSAPSDS